VSREYDAIVVGARCGGSPTAMLLARNGYRVLLVDKATFPSDTMFNAPRPSAHGGRACPVGHPRATRGDGRRHYNDAMADYQRARDEEALPIYEFTCDFAKIEPPPPEMQQLMGAMQGNQEAMDGFVSVMAGTLPAPEFFGSENAGRIMAQAAVPPG
jgi:choline dehydrogenase-like flavoprotein